MLRDIPALQYEPRLHWGPSLIRDSFTSSLGHPCLNECNECHSILDIARKLFHLRQNMRTLLHMRQHEISELILDLESPPRQKRGLGTLIGGTLGWTFGLATECDVDEIKHLMYEVLQGSKQAVNAWSQGQNLVTRVTKLTSERFQHIDQLLNLTCRTLETENDRLQAIRHVSQTTQKLLSKTIEQIHLAIKHLHESESLYLALKDLSNNRLSK